MSIGTVIRLRVGRIRPDNLSIHRMEEGDASALRARFQQVAAAALAHAETLRVVECFPSRAWEASFRSYSQKLAQVRVLRNQLHPVSLRDREELLSGDSLVAETLELFAA